MALGDALMGIGIGLSGRPPLYENIGFQAIQQKAAKDAAAQQRVDKELEKWRKDLFIDPNKYHKKYIPLAQNLTAGFLKKWSDVLNTGDTRTLGNEIRQDFSNLQFQLQNLQGASKWVWDLYKQGDKIVPIKELFDFVETNPGDFTGAEDLANKLQIVGLQYDPKTSTFGGNIAPRVDRLKVGQQRLEPMRETAIQPYGEPITTQLGGTQKQTQTYSLEDAVLDREIQGLLKDPTFMANFLFDYNLSSPQDERFPAAVQDYKEQIRPYGTRIEDIQYTRPRSGGGGGSVTYQFGEQKTTDQLIAPTVSYQRPGQDAPYQIPLAKYSTDVVSISGIGDQKLPLDLTQGDAIYLDDFIKPDGNRVSNKKIEGTGVKGLFNPRFEVYYTAKEPIKITVDGRPITIEKGTALTADFFKDQQLTPDDPRITPMVWGIGYENEDGEFGNQIMFPAWTHEEEIKSQLRQKRAQKEIEANVFDDFESLMEAYRDNFKFFISQQPTETKQLPTNTKTITPQEFDKLTITERIKYMPTGDGNYKLR